MHDYRIYETKEGKKYLIYYNLQHFLLNSLPEEPIKFEGNKRRKYFRIPFGFDIETTTYNDYAYMYHFQINLNNNVFFGRTWDMLNKLFENIQRYAKSNKGNFICFVANLGYEFAYMQNRYIWQSVFAREPRKPITANWDRIEFRDCLALSGIGGLENLAKNFCTTRKLVGDLDYNGILRNYNTKLTEKEEAYCANDVIILNEFAQYCFETWVDKGEKIPLTSTGIVRQMMKKEAEPQKKIIQSIMKRLFPKTSAEYNQIFNFLFRGGYTHGNIMFLGDRVENVVGVDFTSSYPAVMLHFKYPVTPFNLVALKNDGKYITDERIYKQAVFFQAIFYNIKTITNHTIESEHKIIKYSDDAVFDNGRLLKASKIQVMLTEQDYFNYVDFYKWDKIQIIIAKSANIDYLPKYLIRPMMEVYAKKKILKSEGKDDTIEYKNAKSQLNSFYGMTVTRLNFTEIIFNQNTGEWSEEPQNKNYNMMKSYQYLSPFWGIWVTAYARRNLLKTVKKLDNGYFDYNVIYCDTDSIYMIDNARNRKIIEEYNNEIKIKNSKLPEIFSDIGTFDYIDGGVNYIFKTLGAKRYLKYDVKNNILHATVAGMGKGSFEKKYKNLSIIKQFDKFDNNMIFDFEESYKNRCAYPPYPKTDIIDGVEMHEKSCAVILPTVFTLKIDEIYLTLAEKLKNKRRLKVNEMCIES